jgi:transposase-like protein
VIYLFVDAIYESRRLPGGLQEALLCAWGICAEGRRSPRPFGLTHVKARWQRLTITELEQRQLELLRQELQPDPTPSHRPLTELAAEGGPVPVHSYSRSGT